MDYSRLRWNHSSEKEPVEILSEYDGEGWEQRRVEFFADGSIRFAGTAESMGGCQLSLIPRPSDAEVVGESELEISELTGAEFERAWELAHRADRSPRAGVAS